MAHPVVLPRIAIVDHHDSYTRNLLSLICSSVDSPSPDLLARRVVIIPYTHPALAPENVHDHFLPFVDAIILSPGPGDPSNDEDFGSSRRLLQNPALVQVPILGVCLGHQGIATAAGASVRQLTEPFHGRKRPLVMDAQAATASRPNGTRSIVQDIAPGTEVICYNSLVVDESTLPSSIRVLARSPLDAEKPDAESFVQAIEHTEHPYYGVQYHPESIESNAGQTILNNFLHNVDAYWRARDMDRVRLWDNNTCGLPDHLAVLGKSCIAPSRPFVSLPDSAARWEVVQRTIPVQQKSLADTLAFDMVPIVDRLFRQSGHAHAMGGCVWLDSASAKDPQSHMSMMSRASFTLTYDMHAHLALCEQNSDASVQSVELQTDTTLWDWMSEVQCGLQNATVLPFQSSPEPEVGGSTCALQAGFVGYWGYEMKDESLDLGPLDASRYEQTASGAPFDRMALPAAQWGFCNTVLIFDHHTQTWTASALVRRDSNAELHPALATLERTLEQLGSSSSIGVSRDEADAWFDKVQRTLQEVCATPVGTKPPATGLAPVRAVDNRDTYMNKIRQAKDYIGKGESYELCLTTQFEGTLPLDTHNYDAYFDLYTRLRTKNPAPFCAYLELLPLDSETPQAILSTSPERFLTITREGHLEMRPIKGTLVRPGWGKGEEDWLARAETEPSMQQHVQAEDERRMAKLRADPKERAENLMIADLIRADLQAVCYPGSVQVPRLIALETYETVHQLVTAVTGTLRPGIGCVEAGKRCFPPGSMTGAPKRRSVELLEHMERTPGHPMTEATRRRCVYSGALGFIGVDGASNMSVVIRTVTAQGKGVVVGAGGAVTILSTTQGEWDEVLTKLSSVSSLDEANSAGA